MALSRGLDDRAIARFAQGIFDRDQNRGRDKTDGGQHGKDADVAEFVGIGAQHTRQEGATGERPRSYFKCASRPRPIR